VAAANPHHVILRTSWVYAPFGTNFVRTILRLMSERDHLRIVNDQIGCPTYAPDIATATIAIAEMIRSGPWRSEFEGITHLAGPDALTWYAFAERISSGASQRGLRSVPIKPITTSEYPTPAVRPANSRLSSAKLADLFGIRLPPLDGSLSDCLQRLLTA
jgi:dTDP-4-dehydrorhamnose reductase